MSSNECAFSVKVRRGGVGTHFCIHKYFYERSPSWKAIRDEETRAQGVHKKPAANAQVEMDTPDIDEDAVDPDFLEFSPIDARHLSSLPLVRGRVVQLLKSSKNHIHASNNMLLRIVRFAFLYTVAVVVF